MAEMTAEEAAEWGKTLDFPTVWASLQDLKKVVENTSKNIDRIGERVDRTTETLEKSGKEADRKFAETREFLEKMGERVDRTTENINKMGERVDRVTANVGGLNLSMGDLVETLFGPHLGEKFDAYHYNLKRIFRRVPVYDNENHQRSEIDILLSNTVVCMAVEIKRWLDKTTQIDEHIRRMQLIRQYPPAEVKEKKLLGAIAGAVVSHDVREYAEQNGFFVLELTGEDVRLLEPEQGFQPKEW